MPVRLPSHATIVAYLALFVALGTSGYAAERLSHTHAASAGRRHASIKVTCQATRGKMKIRCSVVRGPARRGPIGPQGSAGPQGPMGSAGTAGGIGPPGSLGPQGSSGPSGALGNTQVVDAHVWRQEPGNSDIGAGAVPPRLSGWDFYNYTGGQQRSKFENFFQTSPLSLSEVSGTTTKLQSFQFCYGVHTDFPGDTTAIVDHLWVYRITQPDALGPAGIYSAPTGETATALINQPLNLSTQGCESFTPASSVALDPQTFLRARLSIDVFGAHDAWVYLGRITYTLGP